MKRNFDNNLVEVRAAWGVQVDRTSKVQVSRWGSSLDAAHLLLTARRLERQRSLRSWKRSCGRASAAPGSVLRTGLSAQPEPLSIRPHWHNSCPKNPWRPVGLSQTSVHRSSTFPCLNLQRATSVFHQAEPNTNSSILFGLSKQNNTLNTEETFSTFKDST